MSKDSRRLGRGLNSLLSSTIRAEIPQVAVTPVIDLPEEEVQLQPASEAPPIAEIPPSAPPRRPLAKQPPAPRPLPMETSAPPTAAPAPPALPAATPTPPAAHPIPVDIEPTPEPTPTKPVPIKDPAPSSDPAPIAENTAHPPTVLPIVMIVPRSDQPRRHFDPQGITRLAASIAANGIIQPLVVRPAPQSADQRQPNDKYELVAGERRWRAARAAGIDSVPVLVRQDVDDRATVEMALVENIQREDLNPIDRAVAYRAYCDRFGHSPEELAKRLGEDRTTVVNYMRLLDLPSAVQDFVTSGQLSMGHARCLAGLAEEESQIDLARAAVTHALSVRALEEMVRRRKGSPPRPTQAGPSLAGGPPVAKRPHIADLEGRLQQAIGTKVTIHEGRKKGTGKVIIEYYSLDDFDRIADRLGLSADR